MTPTPPVSELADLRAAMVDSAQRSAAGGGWMEEWACGTVNQNMLSTLGPAAGGVAASSGFAWLPWLGMTWRLHPLNQNLEGLCVWIGQGQRPYLFPYHRRSPYGVARWLTIAAESAADRVWAVEQSIRCSAVQGVVADGRGLGFTATRRLQLAVEQEESADRPSKKLILLRDEQELAQPSAARVRGVIRPLPSGDGVMRWSAELLRRKGLRPTDDLAEGDQVVLEVRHGQTVVVREPAGVADRPGTAAERSGWQAVGA